MAGFQAKSAQPTISIHAPREGGDERQADAQNLRPRDFNPRPPRGGRRSASSGGAFVQAFQSTPPARGATPCIPPAAGSPGNFNPRPPRGGRRLHGAGLFGERGHFNPRPPRGGRRKTLPIVPAHPPFQSTPPARGATPFVLPLSLSAGFQSTPPARGATLVKFPRVAMKRFQSTPPARGATPSRLCAAPPPRFQSTPPARGATQRPSWWWQKFSIFQSTPPARGATRDCQLAGGAGPISIHAPREGGDEGNDVRAAMLLIFQSTPPREGGDFVGVMLAPRVMRFQSTPPARGATVHFASHNLYLLNFNPRPPRGGRRLMFRPLAVLMWISIHAPREGGDISTFFQRSSDPYFNPRPPRGGRQDDPAGRLGDVIFQSTPPARGATTRRCIYASHSHISIHAPREGGDLYRVLCHHAIQDFNPRPPRGGRLVVNTVNSLKGDFNPRPPRGGRPVPPVYQM